MRRQIEKAAVLGAGTMGSRIAAHLANAGIPSFLLDIVPPDADGPTRNKFAAAGLENLKKSKPAAFYEPGLAKLITIGNLEDNLDWLSGCDWIIEAVVEDLEAKRALLKKIEDFRRPGTIVTTNTSGLPVASIAEEFSEEFRRNWFGTHFFNPPRYMRLLEIIPTPESDPEAIAAIERLCDVRLGKGIVVAKDTPNFIANRIGTFSIVNVMRVMQEMDLSIEEIDALTGPAVGWPKSAVFRTVDMVGLDVLGHVINNMKKTSHDERSDLGLPEFFQKMLEHRMLGDKTRGGFYKKQKTEQGEERMALDWKTLQYHPRQKPKFASLEAAKNIEQTKARIKMLLGLDGQGGKLDKGQQFLWKTLTELWTYSANRIPEIADRVVEIDRAMQLGFNWELGPFELWDAAGVRPTVERMRKQGLPVSDNVEKLLVSGAESWYEESPGAPCGKSYFDVLDGGYELTKVPDGVWSVSTARRSKGVVNQNAGASLIDLGDGIGCIEFHSKMNSIGGDIVSFVQQTLGFAGNPPALTGPSGHKMGGAADHFDAFVITNDAANFSVGANIMLLLMSAQEEEWDDIDLMIRQFQNMTQAIKFSPKPVVVAPFGMTLGGGCEVSLHAPVRQAHAELYMGLVEAGVGLLPGGGGCKEMTLRAVDSALSIRPDGRGESVEFMEAMKKAFETIAMARISTSASEARALGMLSRNDAITMNRERVLSDAKTRALELVSQGYKPPVPRTDIPAPGENILATLKLGVHMLRQGEFITEHEVKIATRIAEVLCGGAVSPGTLVSEQYLLDCEREAFKSLVGERKTQERIQHTLKTGKPLRN